MDAEHTAVLAQDDLPTDIGRFCIALVIRKSRSCRFFCTFVPGMSPGFVDDGVGDDLMKTFQLFHDNWERCKGMSGKFWTPYLERTPFNRVRTAHRWKSPSKVISDFRSVPAVDIGAMVWGHDCEVGGRLCAGGKDRRGVTEVLQSTHVWCHLLGNTRLPTYMLQNTGSQD